MESEQSLSMVSNAAVIIEETAKAGHRERKRRLWLGVVAVFGGGGTASGITALVLSFLTYCGVTSEARPMSIAVSMLLIGCLAALLFAAHGMDRLAAIRREA